MAVQGWKGMSETATRSTRPAVFRTVGRAWRSTWSALVHMPLAFLLTGAALLAVNVVLPFLESGAAVQAGGQPGLAIQQVPAVLLGAVLQSLLLAPLAIAMHRFVLLGEWTELLPLAPLGRFLRFAGWLTAVNLAAGLPGLLAQSQLPGIKLAFFLLQITAAVVTTRFVLVFPAVAVQPDGRAARLGWHETKWQFWRIITILVITSLPVFAVTLLVVAWLAGFDFRPEALAQAIVGSPMGRVASAALGTAGAALAAAAASWMFLGYGMAHRPAA